MPEFALASQIPTNARWIKIHYQIRTLAPDAELVAQLWSGPMPENPVVLRGESGDAFVRLDKPQSLSYQHAPNVELRLKVTAYKVGTEER